MTLPKSNLVVRLLTGLVGAPLILLLLYMGPALGWLAFIVVATLIAAFELYAMTHPGDRIAQLVCTALTLGVTGAVWWLGADARALLTMIMALPIIGMFLVLARLGDIQTAALRVAAGTFGPLYLGGGMGAMALLRRDAGAGHEGAGFVVLALAFSWLSDTGAYFAGRAFGKHKLYEAVSPKKTVEGALGGLAAAVTSAVVAHFWFLPSLPLTHGVVLAVVAGALGQAGDLGESLIKRSVGVKDSGGILPGHGGILDRVDAMLVTGVITYSYVAWVR